MADTLSVGDLGDDFGIEAIVEGFGEAGFGDIGKAGGVTRPEGRGLITGALGFPVFPLGNGDGDRLGHGEDSREVVGVKHLVITGNENT